MDHEPHDVQALYRHAKQRMPGGTQLLSKRPEMFAPDVWPAYYRKARGCEVWGLDGKHYFDMTHNGVGACLLGYADPLCTEIERSIDYFKSISGGENIKKVLLSGGTANIPGLAESLTQRLGIETELADPFRKIDYNRKSLTPEEMKAIGSTAAVAIGLALRKIGDK